jgi:adenylate cyclase, class 2
VSARRNVELKAVDPDPDRSLDVCHSIQAIDRGVIQQHDTYFNAAHGVLKLRAESPGRPHLIQYERADQAQQRQSSYRIVAVDDPDSLRTALAAALGIRSVVEKQRRLFLWKEVRIHLDNVKWLGRFIELEAVAPAKSDLSGERKLIEQLRKVLNLTDDRLCARGYADSIVEVARADDA